MTKRLLAFLLATVMLCSLLTACNREKDPVDTDVTTTTATTTTTAAEGDTTTVETTTTQEFTVQTNADGNTIVVDGDGNVIADSGEGDTIATGEGGSIVITDEEGETQVITRPTTTATQSTTTDSTTVNNTTTGGTTNNKTDSPTTTTTTAAPPAQENPSDTPKYTGILPGSAEAGTVFATLAKAPADKTVTVNNDTKQFGRFLITTSDNTGLPFNVACHLGDDRITALVPASADLSKIKANFTYYGKNVTYNGAELTSRATVMDLTKDVTLTLNAKDGSSKTMTVHIEKLATGLPSMTLNTSGYAAIASTTEYKSASFSIGGGNTSVCSYATSTYTKGADCSVKGRGNTTWGYPKKAYTLRFDTKYSLLGLPESKNYVLLALHADQSLMRYRLAEYLSESMGLEYTMNLRYVDLWLNGEYVGVYGLVEKIEVEKNRVAITDYLSPQQKANQVGYLLEFDDHLYESATDAQRKQWSTIGKGFYDPVINEVFFHSDALGTNDWIMIRTTNAKNLTAEHVNYIYAVIELASKALKEGDYATISKLIDVESFVRWYLIEEYLNNTDTDMASSVYMYIDVGGKLKLGPLWDVDNSAGNHNETASATAHALYDSKEGWFSYLFQCSEARAILKTEWAKMQSTLSGVNKTLDDTAAMLDTAAELNFIRWDILGTNMNTQPPAIKNANTYAKQVSYLKDFLAQRQKALDSFYSGL